MERVDDYKDRFKFYAEAAEVKNGQPYQSDVGWMVTTKPQSPPYHRPRQKRQAGEIIEKALNQEA